jgi:hypothetical protein
MLRDGTGLCASVGRLATTVPAKTEALRAMLSGGACEQDGKVAQAGADALK